MSKIIPYQNTIQAYSNSNSTQKVKKFNNIAMHMLYKKVKKEGDWGQLPRPIIHKMLFEFIPDSFKNKYSIYKKIFIDEKIDFETQKNAVINLLQKAPGENVSSVSGVLFFIKQYLGADININVIANNLQSLVPSLLFNIITTHHKLPSELIDLHGCITQEFIRLFIENDILDKDEETIRKIQNTENLYCFGQKLKILPITILNCKNVKGVFLQENDLSYIPPEFGEFSNLEALYIQNNKLTFLPDSIGKCKKLERLMLQGNNLSFLPYTIGECENLEVLDLYDSKLTFLPKSIEKCKKLKELNLYNNNLSSIPPGLKECNNLHYLNLNENNELKKFAKLYDNTEACQKVLNQI